MEGGDILGPNVIPFTVYDGYEIVSVDLELELDNMPNPRRFDVIGCQTPTWLSPSTPTNPAVTDNQKHHFPGLEKTGGGFFMAGASGDQTIAYIVGNTNVGIVRFILHLKLTDANWNTWAQGIYNTLFDAAQTAYYAEQARYQSRIATLQDMIDNVDTLTLRREENEEIMKYALRWLLGPRFEFVPDSVIAYLTSGLDSAAISYGVNYTGNQSNVSSQEWSIVTQYESLINFINEAIEWGNVIYFLYSYFWDLPRAWSNIRRLSHPDMTHQAFLRAGAARIVLTVRKGYEASWTWFTDRYETSPPGPDVPLSNYPYMTIAQQIQDYDNTNYPGIPAANPDNTSTGGVDDGNSPAGTTSSASVTPSQSVSDSTVNIPVADSTGFKVGSTAIIDSWDSGVQESQKIVSIPNRTHIVVAGLKFAHNGNPDHSGPFPIIQVREKGVLIAEWFEYTPSKGTFIVVNSDLKTMDIV